MVERIQDLNLPNTNVSKIIKDSLPADVNLDKEARTAIARATSVFIMYLSSNAATIAHKQNHKTFSAQDVFDAIDEMEFKEFIEPMKSTLGTFKKKMQDKKIRKSEEVKSRTSTASGSGKDQTPVKVNPFVIEIDDSD